MTLFKVRKKKDSPTARTPAKPIKPPRSGSVSAQPKRTPKPTGRTAGRSVSRKSIDMTKPNGPPASVKSSPAAITTSKPTAIARRGEIPSHDDAYWYDLRILAESYYDLQKYRIGFANRIARAPVNIEHLEPFVVELKAQEHQAGLLLDRCFRGSGYREFVKQSAGVGDRLVARLLGHLGHPNIAVPHWHEGRGAGVRKLMRGAPFDRTVGQLWQYCGHGDPAMRRRKGMDADDIGALGSPTCKMLVRLIAKFAIAEGGRSVERWRETGAFGDGEAVRPLRRVYEQRLMATVDREGWTKDHKHNDALRIVGKEFLRDLWGWGRYDA